MGNLSPIVALFVNSMQKSQVFSVFFMAITLFTITFVFKIWQFKFKIVISLIIICKYMKKEYLLGGGIILSVILSIVAICRTYPIFVDLSSIGIIFAAMSVVVTALIGSQIIQYLQVDKRMREIANTEIKSTVEELIESSFKKEHAFSYVFMARAYTIDGAKCGEIHNYFRALKEIQTISNEHYRNTFASFVANELYESLKMAARNNSLQIYSEYRHEYLKLLDCYSSPISMDLRTIIKNANPCTDGDKNQ